MDYFREAIKQKRGFLAVQASECVAKAKELYESCKDIPKDQLLSSEAFISMACYTLKAKKLSDEYLELGQMLERKA